MASFFSSLGSLIITGGLLALIGLAMTNGGGDGYCHHNDIDGNGDHEDSE